MFHKENYIRKSSSMSFMKKCICYLQQRSRSLSSLKIIILIIISFILLIYFVFFNSTNQLCDPTKHLSWFCSWPDPETTVCSWENHFPTISKKIR